MNRNDRRAAIAIAAIMHLILPVTVFARVKGWV